MRIILLLLSLFTINVGAGQVVLLAENFNNGLPSGWIATATDNQTPNNNLPFNFNTPWILVESGSSIDSSLVTTSYFETAMPAERWLILPEVSLGSYGNYLRFKSKSGDASFPDSMVVLVAENSNDPQDFIDTIAQFNTIADQWENFEVNLSEMNWNNQDVFIAFKVFSTDGYLLYLDNISVTIDDPSSADEIILNKINIFPIPAKNKLSIELQTSSELMLYDISGKLLLKRSNFTQGEIDVSHLNRGSYIISWSNEMSIGRRKIILQ